MTLAAVSVQTTDCKGDEMKLKDTTTRAAPLLLGAGLGAALMYLLDPKQGRARRELALAEMEHLGRSGADWADSQYHELKHRARAHAEPPRRGFGLVHLLGLAAAGLAVRALVRSEPVRERVAQLNHGQRVELEQSIEINAAPEQVFEQWSNYENFPRFMSMVEEVRPLGGDRSHWTVKGPAGTRVEWDAEVTERERGRLLAWRSLPNAEIDHRGRVDFIPSGQGTRLTVRMSYDPPGGRVGHFLAGLLGRNPQQEMSKDLKRMKEYVESQHLGHATSGGLTADTAARSSSAAGPVH